jgi:large subunit ribosomal protein L4
MGECKLFKSADASVSTVSVDVEAFGRRSPRRVQREAVLMYQANKRAGTHDTLDRSEVRATKKKPYKQKGTGRARAGKKSSPVWRGGGVAHGPHPRDYSYALPRKALRVAARAAIAGKLRDGEVAFTDALAFEKPSTKQAAAMLASLGIERTCLVVTAEADDNVYRSMRNIPGVRVMQASDVNAYEVLRHRTLLLTQESFDALHGRLAAKPRTAVSGGAD